MRTSAQLRPPVLNLTVLMVRSGGRTTCVSDGLTPFCPERSRNQMWFKDKRDHAEHIPILVLDRRTGASCGVAGNTILKDSRFTHEIDVKDVTNE